ncbi:ABC transporter ATP-binding protein [Streptomyces nanshensis]|uniref:ABC transporter ATP-binding protein n=1 Tax=Streptomyces nanshensis TaxID=518642 RepID=UPI00114CED23|nr:ABC transporter ATP-binding protein [Streptomyces nanshensis]
MISSLIRPVQGRLTLAVGLMALASLVQLVPALAIAELAREFAPSIVAEVTPDETASYWTIGWVAVGAIFAMLVLFMAAGLVSHLADSALSLHVRRRLVDHLGRVPLGWFGRRSSGTVRKVVQDDVSALHHLVAHATLDVTAATVVPVVSLLYLFVVDWRLTLIMLIPVVIGLVSFSLAMRGAMAKYAEYDASLARLGAASVELVDGITVVKAFGETGRAHRAFREAGEQFSAFFYGWMRQTARASVIFEVAISPSAILATVLAGAGLLVGTGRMAALDVLPFALLALGITGSMVRFMYGTQQVREGRQAAERIGEVLSVKALPEPASEEAVSPTTGHGAGHVAYEQAEFSYNEATKAVRGVSLELRPGSVTALVGPSGSGKSTLARLLPRFDDVDAGAVRLGGLDIRRLPTRHLYEHVGFVFQDVALLRTTVRDNIRLGRPDAGDEAVRAAARAAQIHQRVLDTPRGYDSVVGDDTVFSGGEAQRISIARALLADAPVLVLDEATAFADPESEAAVQEALSQLVAGRTLLVIAHRLHTIKGVDQIAVMDSGRVVELGTHEQLLSAGGRYSRLWNAYENGRTGSESFLAATGEETSR